MSVPNVGDILQTGFGFGYLADYEFAHLVVDTAFGSSVGDVATIPARTNSVTWPGNTVLSFYNLFWYATNNHTSDVVLRLLPDFAGVNTAEYAMAFTIPAGDTVPIAHGFRVDATIPTAIYAWASVANVIVLRGHTTRVVTDVQ